MAKAISYTPPVSTPAQRLETATQQAEPAVSEALELLGELHGHGVLELGIKLIRGGEGLTAGALDKLTGETSANLLRNLVEVGKLAGTVDPRELEILMTAVGSGVKEAARSVEAGERVTLPQAMRLLGDPDVQLALGAAFGLLRGVGASLRVEREQEGQHD